MCSQKFLHHHERCFVGDEVFWSLKDFWTAEGWKRTFFSSPWVFSFEKHFLHTCNWFCPQKKKCIHNSMLLWKKDAKMTVKENKIISSKVKSYFRTLFWPFLEKEEISKNIYFVLFGEMKLVETLSLLIDIKLKQISNAQKKN